MIEHLVNYNNKLYSCCFPHVRNIQIEDLLGRDTIRTDKCPVKNLIKDSVILVTGGAGSIGSEIVRQVASYGAKKIVLLDQAETPMHDMALEMKSNYPNIDIELFIGDVQNKERARIVFETFHPQYVFHAPRNSLLGFVA